MASKIITFKRIFAYFGIALLLNVFVFFGLSYYFIGEATGEIQMLYILVGVWAAASSFIYLFYFLLPLFKQKWEVYAGLFFPTIVLSFLAFKMPIYITAVGFNFVLNLVLAIRFYRQNNLKQ